MKNLCFALSAFALTLPAIPLAHAHAEEGVLLDYRDSRFRDAQPATSAADKARITTALAATSSEAVKALGKDFVVLGHARGVLAKAGEVDFFLLSLARPAAAEPFPKTAAQVIVAMKGKDAVAAYALPAQRQYARLVGVVDMEGDGTSEALLESSGYNMGQLLMSIDAVKLEANGATRVAQSVPEVYSDTCDNPVGAKNRASKTIRLTGAKLVATVHPEKCG
jgi:hypothetical protein